MVWLQCSLVASPVLIITAHTEHMDNFCTFFSSVFFFLCGHGPPGWAKIKQHFPVFLFPPIFSRICLPPSRLRSPVVVPRSPATPSHMATSPRNGADPADALRRPVPRTHSEVWGPNCRTVPTARARLPVLAPCDLGVRVPPGHLCIKTFSR